MPPQDETTPLVNDEYTKTKTVMFSRFSFEDDSRSRISSTACLRRPFVILLSAMAALMLIVTVIPSWANSSSHRNSSRNDPLLHHQEPIGPYELVEYQHGHEFLQYYDFYVGADSLGSAGHNSYVSQHRAQELNIIQVDRQDNVILSSAPTAQGMRESIRLHGKRRFNRGLFVLDVNHVPAGCGVWPAFWLTDEDNWPNHGEIDIVEGVNTLATAKTALHTSESCSMYAHVPSWAHTGTWDRASGIPDTWNGVMDVNTSVPADNCWNMAAHQWANQGCVVAETRQDTIGTGFNRKGGGVYALEWDPAYGYIKSWVWAQDEIPANLMDAMLSADNDKHERVVPDPTTWDVPYAYFAIGNSSGCSADHFQNHHIILNLAFCGTVAGNRFQMDCPLEANWTQLSDPVAACNAYIESIPEELGEAYWDIRGVYVYERSLQANATNATLQNQTHRT
jgi:hypothetical protein